MVPDCCLRGRADATVRRRPVLACCARMRRAARRKPHRNAACFRKLCVPWHAVPWHAVPPPVACRSAAAATPTGQPPSWHCLLLLRRRLPGSKQGKTLPLSPYLQLGRCFVPAARRALDARAGWPVVSPLCSALAVAPVAQWHRAARAGPASPASLNSSARPQRRGNGERRGWRRPTTPRPGPGHMTKPTPPPLPLGRVSTEQLELRGGKFQRERFAIASARPAALARPALHRSAPAAQMAALGPAMLPSVDVTAELNELLGQRGARPTPGRPSFDADALEGFLREAYRIVRLRAEPSSCCCCARAPGWRRGAAWHALTPATRTRT